MILSGTASQGRLDFPLETTVYSTTEHGEETVVHGDPDRRVTQPGGIASLTKMMTAWVARQTLRTPDQLLEQIEVLPEDRHRFSYRRLKAGDVLTFRGLIYAAMLASDNTAPLTIARGVGYGLDKKTNDPVGRFVQEMNTTARALGYSSAEFSTPWNFGRMTPRDIADLHRRLLTESFLLRATGYRQRTLKVEGPRARSLTVVHQAHRTAAKPLEQVFSAKTGTWPAGPHGRGHLSAAWKDAEGQRHITVIVNSGLGDQRYSELRKVISAIR